MSVFNRMQGEEQDVFQAGSWFDEEFRSPHYSNCPTQDLPIGQCSYCGPPTTPTPNYPSPPQTFRTPYFGQGQNVSPRSHPTYAQMLQSSPSPAPRPQQAQAQAQALPQQRVRQVRAGQSTAPRQPTHLQSPRSVGVKPQPLDAANSYANIAALGQARAGTQGYRAQPAPNTPQRAFPITNHGRPESSAQAQQRSRMNVSWQQLQAQHEQLRRQQAALTPQIKPQHLSSNEQLNLDEFFDDNFFDFNFNFMDWATESQATQARLNNFPTRFPQPTPSTQRPATPPRSTTGTNSSQRSARRTREEMLNSPFGHACPNCGHRFISAGECNKHIRRVHGAPGSRPHKCEYCPYRGNHPREVDRHVASIHPEKLVDPPRFYCTYNDCLYQTKGFPRKDHLKRHARNKHGEEGSVSMSRTSSAR